MKYRFERLRKHNVDNKHHGDSCLFNISLSLSFSLEIPLSTIDNARHQVKIKIL